MKKHGSKHIIIHAIWMEILYIYTRYRRLSLLLSVQVFEQINQQCLNRKCLTIRSTAKEEEDEELFC